MIDPQISDDPQEARRQGAQAAIAGFDSVRQLPATMQAWLDGYWVESLNLMEAHLAQAPSADPELSPCCGAFTSIGDDGIEYCKGCYQPVRSL